jgi:hypothetical protein
VEIQFHPSFTPALDGDGRLTPGEKIRLHVEALRFMLLKANDGKHLPAPLSDTRQDVISHLGKIKTGNKQTRRLQVSSS